MRCCELCSGAGGDGNGGNCPHCKGTGIGAPSDAGRKDDAKKPRMDLIDGYAMEELAKVLTFGAEKYAEHNWRKGIAVSRLLAALLRHTFAMVRGEDIDEETGLAHAAHAMCCCMFLVWTMRFDKKMDDRWRSGSMVEQIKESVDDMIRDMGVSGRAS